MEPIIVPRGEHGISRKGIDADALDILYRLHRHGFKAYIVGGGVRDLMLGITPKDFDIATDAKPGKLKRLFRNCRIIGRRFRLAHLHYANDKIIEVATFRSSGESDAVVRDGDLIRRDNVFGTPEEDAHRRDITINALFYNIADFSVIDYVGGVEDLRTRTIRTIADPVRSFREDPVRILRALRHGTRIDFELEDETLAAVHSEMDELQKVNKARLLEELYKDLGSGKSRAFFQRLHKEGLLEVFAPDLVDTFGQSDEGDDGEEIYLERLERLDRIAEGNFPISHVLGLTALLSPLIIPVTRDCEDPDAKPRHPPYAAFQEALSGVFQNLKIYRRDEERLWHALGAWPRVFKAFERRSIPRSLSSRVYFADAVEIFLLLNDESDEIDEFVEYARSLPPPDPQPETRRRPRRRRPQKNGGQGDQPASSEARKKKRRRRRRKRESRSSEEE